MQTQPLRFIVRVDMKTKEQKEEYRKEWCNQNKEKLKGYYKKYHDKTKDYRKEYYEIHKEEIKTRVRERALVKHEDRLLDSCKRSSIRKNLDFNLELSDIVIPTHCPYLNLPITNILGKGRIWTNPSVDRKDPTKGYTKDNIEIISMKANTMKQNATEEELISFAKAILERKGLI